MARRGRKVPTDSQTSAKSPREESRILGGDTSEGKQNENQRWHQGKGGWRPSGLQAECPRLTDGPSGLREPSEGKEGDGTNTQQASKWLASQSPSPVANASSSQQKWRALVIVPAAFYMVVSQNLPAVQPIRSLAVYSICITVNNGHLEGTEGREFNSFRAKYPPPLHTFTSQIHSVSLFLSDTYTVLFNFRFCNQ